MLYEMLTGDVPFRGDTAVAVAYQHVSERPVRPSERDPQVAAELDRVVMHSMAKDRAKRFQTAGEFREALKLAASGQMPNLPTSQTNDTVLFSGGEEVSESDLAIRQLSEGGGTRSQSRPPVMWTWAAILTVAAVIAAVVFWLMNLAPTEFDTSSRVPDLEDVPRAHAMKTLQDLELVPVTIEEANDDIDEDRVIRTDPPAGSTLAKNSSITVYVSAGPKDIAVPNVVGDSQDDATKKLEDLKLKVGSVSTKDDDSAPKDSVISIKPEAGAKVKPGQKIDLTVSSGKVKVPDVTGQPLQAARSLLDGLGLEVNAVPRDCEITDEGLPIVEQSAAGSQDQGSSVDIVYCTGSDGQPAPGGDDDDDDDD
jgi:beta-lactam-binding protein with PASTA domain